ncbi:MAG TPA: SDR family NAD(P)-dependent oxidoreductase [Bryobacteraceae bacterium]|nr:SDR family NAD(P)-dependent oxidoreductase [Bryobacteraceae bacterium]
MTFDFAGKRAVVTGGASGIGLATVNLLRESGAEVFVIDRETGVSNSAALERAFPENLDIVIANAGIGSQAPLIETSDELWERTLATNLSGVFYTVRAAGRMMKPRRAGSIVITASTNSYDGEPNLTAYNATKAGLLGILHTAANELGPYGIRVNAVCPGLIRTPLTEAHFANPELLQDYFRHIPLGRGGEAIEVARAIAFLASEAASYITGAALLVDGGQMATKFGTWDESVGTFVNGRWTLK